MEISKNASDIIQNIFSMKILKNPKIYKFCILGQRKQRNMLVYCIIRYQIYAFWTHYMSHINLAKKNIYSKILGATFSEFVTGYKITYCTPPNNTN